MDGIRFFYALPFTYRRNTERYASLDSASTLEDLHHPTGTSADILTQFLVFVTEAKSKNFFLGVRLGTGQFARAKSAAVN